MTADNKNNPNNVYGWGLINAYDAVLYWGIAMSNKPEITIKDNQIYISTFVLSKNEIDKNNVKLYYSFDGSSFSEASMEQTESLNDTNTGKYSVTIPDNPQSNEIKMYFSATDTQKNLLWPYKAPEKFFIYHKDSGEIEIY
jgi:hypothetical protein